MFRTLLRASGVRVGICIPMPNTSKPIKTEWADSTYNRSLALRFTNAMINLPHSYKPEGGFFAYNPTGGLSLLL